MDLPSWMNEFLQVVFGAVTFPARGKIKFTGTAVTSVTDDPDNDQIVVQIDGGAGGGSSGGSAGTPQLSDGAGGFSHDAAFGFDAAKKVTTIGARSWGSLSGSDPSGVGVFLAFPDANQLAFPDASSIGLRLDVTASRQDAQGVGRSIWEIVAHTHGGALVIDALEEITPEGASLATIADSGFASLVITTAGLVMRLHGVAVGGASVSFTAFVEFYVMGGV